MKWTGLTFFLFLLALLLKVLSVHFSYDTFLLVGSDGPYYPLQVRAIIERGELAFADMPLLFWLEALVAKLLISSGIPQQKAIIWTNQTVPALLSSLAIFPVAAFARDLQEKPSIPILIVRLFALFNISTMHAFPASLLHKNAVAVSLIFTFLYYGRRAMLNGDRTNWALASLFLVLCALTHFGSFAFLLLFSFVFVWINQRKSRQMSGKNIGWFGMLLLLSLGLLWVFDVERFERLLFLPTRLFSHSLASKLVSGQPMQQYVNPINYISSLVLFAVGVMLWQKVKRRLGEIDRRIGLTAIWTSFILLLPVLGIEWTSRAQMLAFIPLSILYILTFSVEKAFRYTILSQLLLTGVICLAILSAFLSKMEAITVEAYAEYGKVQRAVSFPEHALLIGRQDLRLLGSWEWGCQNMSDLRWMNDSPKPAQPTFLIRQIAGSRLTGRRFRQMSIPASAKEVFAGSYLKLYQLEQATADESD
ncbi:MAG: hypothetical protein AAF206_06480 [Bacteroidota bacterium]